MTLSSVIIGFVKLIVMQKRLFLCLFKLSVVFKYLKVIFVV